MAPDDAPNTGAGRHRRRSAPEPFHAEVVEGAQGRPVVVVSGEIDMATAEELWDRMEEALGRDRRLVLDLRDTTFMDSTGLATLARTRQFTDPSDEGIILRAPQSAVLHVLEVSGLDQFVTIDGE